jgi:hypothetical protein
MTKLTSREKAKNIDLGMRRGAALALAKHKRDGIPIAVMKDGKVIRIPPEDIVVPEVE